MLLLEWPLYTTLRRLVQQRAHFAAFRAVVAHRPVVLDAQDLALLVAKVVVGGEDHARHARYGKHVGAIAGELGGHVAVGAVHQRDDHDHRGHAHHHPDQRQNGAQLVRPQRLQREFEGLLSGMVLLYDTATRSSVRFRGAVRPCPWSIVATPGSLLPSRLSEPFRRARRVFQVSPFFHRPSQHRHRNHLRDLLAGLQLHGRIAQVRHHHQDLAAVAGIDHAARRCHPPRRHGRPVPHQQSQRRAGLRMARLHGNAGPHPHRGPRRQHSAFQRKHVVTQVLARMGHHRQPAPASNRFTRNMCLMVADQGLAALAKLASAAHVRMSRAYSGNASRPMKQLTPLPALTATQQNGRPRLGFSQPGLSCRFGKRTRKPNSVLMRSFL